MQKTLDKILRSITHLCFHWSLAFMIMGLIFILTHYFIWPVAWFLNKYLGWFFLLIWIFPVGALFIYHYIWKPCILGLERVFIYLPAELKPVPKLYYFARGGVALIALYCIFSFLYVEEHTSYTQCTSTFKRMHEDFERCDFICFEKLNIDENRVIEYRRKSKDGVDHRTTYHPVKIPYGEEHPTDPTSLWINTKDTDPLKGLCFRKDGLASADVQRRYGSDRIAGDLYQSAQAYKKTIKSQLGVLQKVLYILYFIFILNGNRKETYLDFDKKDYL